MLAAADEIAASVSPTFNPQLRQRKANMKKFVLTAAALLALSVPAFADWRADTGFTNAYDGFVRVRDVPNGRDIIEPLANGVRVSCYERVTDGYGDIWTHIVVGSVSGWSRGTSLTCDLFGRS
jgi:hypothetical protein